MARARLTGRPNSKMFIQRSIANRRTKRAKNRQQTSRSTCPEQCEQPGFSMVIAEATDRSLIGFAYGLTFAPERLVGAMRVTSRKSRRVIRSSGSWNSSSGRSGEAGRSGLHSCRACSRIGMSATARFASIHEPQQPPFIAHGDGSRSGPRIRPKSVPWRCLLSPSPPAPCSLATTERPTSGGVLRPRGIRRRGLARYRVFRRSAATRSAMPRSLA